MADHANHAFTPDEIAKAKLGVDLKKVVTAPEAVAAGHPSETGHPEPTHAEVAEQTRLQQEARPDGRPDRDDKLVHVGRGQQTSGRQ